MKYMKSKLVGLTSTHNQRECMILTKKLVPKNQGTYDKIGTQKSLNTKLEAFLLSEKTYHPDKKVLDIKSTFEFYLFYQRIR